MLMRFGFIIEDYSKEVEYIKRKCCELCPHRERSDGWATTFKLFAWRAVAYDLVLHADLDACFAGRAPARSLEDLQLRIFGITCAHQYPRPCQDIMDFTLGKPQAALR
eukprot:s2108_g1.t1